MTCAPSTHLCEIYTVTFPLRKSEGSEKGPSSNVGNNAQLNRSGRPSNRNGEREQRYTGIVWMELLRPLTYGSSAET
jgi:hypothetical protein